jgi:uncharacterized SAM-binding protein YcdF (DUF218 family)
VSLSALPTALLIPPLNLLPLGLAGVAASWRWPRLGRCVAALALVGLFVLSTPLASGMLFASLEVGLPTSLQPPANHPPEAIVILGGDASYAARVGGIDPGSGIGALTLERMRGGAQLYQRTGLPVLVTGGPLEDGAVPIAVQMADALQNEFDTPVRWVEPASDDTWQNAQFSAAMLRRDGIDSVYVVTHAWHMRRALIAFARTGMTATPAPLRLDRRPEFTWDDLIPHASSFVASYYALHEWIGCVYYALRH